MTVILQDTKGAPLAKIDPAIAKEDLEDLIDAEIAGKRIQEIEDNPSLLIRGNALKKRLAKIGL